MATRYINMRYSGGETETIDEFDSVKEAREMVKEYRMAYPAGYALWVSQRCTKDWRESDAQ